MKKAIVVTSGGMDSTCALYLALEVYDEVKTISFNYGQRHKKELLHAEAISMHLCLEHKCVDISSIKELLHTSALTNDDIEVPEGHYEEASMADTVVPNRNMIMGSIAAAWAVNEGAQAIVMGVHAGDHAVYADCRLEFLHSMAHTIFIGNRDSATFDADAFHIWAPFVDKKKTEIVDVGHELEVPWDMTWTCYNGDTLHCGRCSTCVERLEAFHIAGIEDPVEYEDRSYWIEACK